MELKLLKDLIEAAGYEAYSYSGRGMMGRQCVGLTCSDVNTAIDDLFEAVFDADVEDVANEQEEYDARMSAHSALCDALRPSLIGPGLNGYGQGVVLQICGVAR